MFDSVFLDIGVGVAVVFFIAASVISAFNEWVTRLLDIRAKVLWKALSNALDGNQTDPFVISLFESLTWFWGSDVRPTVADGLDSKRLTSLLANTNLVSALGGQTRLKRKSRDAAAPVRRPRTKVDAIAGTTFSNALIAAAHQTSSREVLDELAQARRAHTTASQLVGGVAGVGAADVIDGWVEATNPGTLGVAVSTAAARGSNVAELVAKADPIAESARAWAIAAQALDEGLPEGPDWLAYASALQGPMLDAIDDVERRLGVDVVDELRQLTNGTAVGEVIDAATFGTDSSIEGITASIATWFDAHMERVSELYKLAARKVLFVVGLVLAVGLNLSAIDLVDDLKNNSNARTALAAGVDASCQDDSIAACQAELVEIIDADTGQISLPGIGEWTDPYSSFVDRGTEADRDSRIELVLGWLITGFAISFGAPFWFDVVQKLSSYRRTTS